MKLQVALLAVLTLTACTAQVTPPPTATPPPTTAPLTVAQAKKAALLVADLPKGWDGGVAVDPTPTPGYRGQYDPPECLVFRHPTDILGGPATAVRGQYFTRDPRQSVTEFVWSWPTQVRTLVPELTDRLAKCSTYTLVGPDQVKYELAISRLPLHGSAEAIALRVNTAAPAAADPIAPQYFGYAARGGTVINIEGWGETLTDAVFAQLVSKAAARLDAAVG